MKISMRMLAPLLPALFILQAGWATTLVRLSLDGLVRAADAVARVHCVGAESRWESGSIWTLTNFSVQETMKGNLPAEVSVRLPGGRVGHLTASVDGAPKFAPGEDAVVFLERLRNGEFTLTAWSEGTFRVSRDTRTSAETVTQDSSTFRVFDPGTRTFQSGGVRRMPLEEFRARIVQAVARGREKSQ